MNEYVVFWAVVILFSLVSFTYMSFKILFRGFPELLEMFDIIKQQIAERVKDSSK